MDASWRLAIAAVFIWLGMVLAISFIEAPLKFRAPGVDLKLGLAIGRLVFRALNVCELLLAVVIAVALFTHESTVGLDVTLTVAVAALLIQIVLVRPFLARRTSSVLAGEGEGRRSGGHYAYVALEVVKVAALIAAGVQLTGV
ncbi:hypothetical protein CIW52_32235 [Mycolicibacterium sp. P9-64]|nr:hypothetical protein CIW52_32235 [Mycolicibacterium sp. P9-64]